MKRGSFGGHFTKIKKTKQAIKFCLECITGWEFLIKMDLRAIVDSGTHFPLSHNNSLFVCLLLFPYGDFKERERERIQG